METKELQNEIKSDISSINWKIPKLAEVLFVALHDEVINEENEQKRFYEKLKGQLKRESTPPDLLKNYLRIIREHPEYEKARAFKPHHIPSNCISKSMESELKNISESITKKIKRNEQGF